jgi:hypothetical protein
VKQKLNRARHKWVPALDRYDQQQKILGQRNSYSKTDPDATFMRMKEDHMRNGQLKAGYNVQVSTNQQYIVSYSLHQSPADTGTLIDHVKKHIKQTRSKPANITADAGYGSEQNYQWLEDKRITAYVKHNQFDRQQKRSIAAKTPYAADKLVYDPEQDMYTCPRGKPMSNLGSYTRTTALGYPQQITKYGGQDCRWCPLKKACHGQKGNRVIEVNHNLNRLKKKADKRLKTKKGVQKRKQRCFDTEPVFGNIKQNHHFKRFMLRGIEKVTIETGLLALAHNLRKKAA